MGKKAEATEASLEELLRRIRNLAAGAPQCFAPVPAPVPMHGQTTPGSPTDVLHLDLAQVASRRVQEGDAPDTRRDGPFSPTYSADAEDASEWSHRSLRY